jgi:hypothetical protein
MSNTALKLLVPCLLLATAAFAQGKAELKVGTAVEKYEITGASDSFQVAPNTRLYAGTKVSGVENAKITVVFLKDGKEASKVELNVPHARVQDDARRGQRRLDGEGARPGRRGARLVQLPGRSFWVNSKFPPVPQGRTFYAPVTHYLRLWRNAFWRTASRGGNKVPRIADKAQHTPFLPPQRSQRC